MRPSIAPLKRLRSNFFTFAVLGVVNTSVTYALYLLLNLIVVYWLAYTASYVAGIVLSYLLNTRLVFRVNMKWSTFLAYPSVYVVQYGVSVLVLGLLVEQLGVREAWAPLLVVVAVLPLTFVLARTVLTYKAHATADGNN